MIQKVKKYMEQYHMIEQGDKIVAGVSGGADSIALLFVLQELQEQYGLCLYVVHINHGIRQEAAEDAEYVRKLCKCLNLPFFLFEEDIPALARKNGFTEEEMGREYRYECFCRVMEKVGADKLAVAHHMDDQAETVLFHLVRGSRLAGMEGMKPVSERYMKSESVNGLKFYRILRPLLSCRKTEIMEWLEKKKIEWKEDYTNQDSTYSRNCIRNEIVPVLEQVNSQAVKHITEFAQDVSEYRAFFDEAVKKYLQEELLAGNIEAGIKINRHRLKKQAPVLAKEVIYHMTGLVCGVKRDVTTNHIQAVYDLLDNQSGKKVMLPYHVVAEISYEMLIIRKDLEEIQKESFQHIVKMDDLLKETSNNLQIELPYGGVLELSLYMKEDVLPEEWSKMYQEAVNSKNSYTKFFNCVTIKNTLHIRAPKRGDYLVIHENGSRKKLSRYFIDKKVPLEERNKKLVVANDQDVLWVVGERRSENYKIKKDTTCILKMTYKGD